MQKWTSGLLALLYIKKKEILQRSETEDKYLLEHLIHFIFKTSNTSDQHPNYISKKNMRQQDETRT